MLPLGAALSSTEDGDLRWPTQARVRELSKKRMTDTNISTQAFRGKTPKEWTPLAHKTSRKA